MNVLIIGSGGREHAMAWAVCKSPLLDKLYTLPGNAGCETISERIKNVSVMDNNAVIKIIKEKFIEFVIVGPESPLINGLADEIRKIGVPVFGCSAKAAQMEGSKIFAKKLMLENGIPTALCEVFTESEKACKYIDKITAETESPIVVKADGEAAGKGVYVCNNPEDAKKAVINIIDNKIFGKSGDSIIIEEFLDGQETTVLSFVDGEDFFVMPASQDYKRAFDGDKGLNTGGMGCYSPVPAFTDEYRSFTIEKIIKPTLKALADMGIKYQGVLYTGLALTSKGPKVVEFNVRFGDPETQVILPLMKSDFLEACVAVAYGKLKKVNIEFFDKKAVSVVMASGGYPENYERGFEISGIQNAKNEGTLVFHAGTEMSDSKTVTSGGRVLNVTVIGEEYTNCIEKVYSGVNKIDFSNKHFRTDIGKRLLQD